MAFQSYILVEKIVDIMASGDASTTELQTNGERKIALITGITGQVKN